MLGSAPKNQIQYWVSHPIAELGSISQGATVLMGHCLVIFVQGYDPSIFVVDLRDNSIQRHSPFQSSCQGDNNYTFTKYGENQIIILGNERYKKVTSRMIWMTIESFKRNIHFFKDDLSFEKALKIKFEEIGDENTPSLAGHTADIYQDCLYFCARRSLGIVGSTGCQVWCFDLKKRTWKECETTGSFPGRERARSFIREDRLHIYGGYSWNLKAEVSFNDLWVLNLKTMEWNHIRHECPQPGQDSRFIQRFSVNVYGDNMLVMKNESDDDVDKLYCCNRKTLDLWMKVDVRGIGEIRLVGNAVIYKNLFYACVTNDKDRKNLTLASFDLDSKVIKFGRDLLRLLGLVLLSQSTSAEEEQLNSLFMSENESDIKFKVQDKIIPAHKKVLIENSKFFSNLFKSGMMESRIEVIDIEDCEYDVFKEFIRFLYCGTVDRDFWKFDQLFALADKYVQGDLYERCVNILAHRITPDSICTLLDFARKNDIFLLKGWCLKLFPKRINMGNITQMIRYLQDEEDPEYKEENERISESAIDFVIDKLPLILQEERRNKENLKWYANFLIPYVSEQRILKFTDLFKGKNAYDGPPFFIFSEEMAQLWDAVFNYVFTNFQEKNIRWQYNSNFFCEYCKYETKRREQKKEAREIELKTQSINGGTKKAATKRMEPCNIEKEEAGNGPTLKKSK